MSPSEFLKHLEDDKIVRAITAAERDSSGQIRVYVSHKKRLDAMVFARRRFVDLGMTRTRHRNGVLIYVVPRTRRFAVVGDVGVNEKCGDDFWQEVSAGMSERLRQGQFTEAILEAIGRVGDMLAKHFPRGPDDRNELPDELARD
jgi:uncharacterized membrane protein